MKGRGHGGSRLIEAPRSPDPLASGSVGGAIEPRREPGCGSLESIHEQRPAIAPIDRASSAERQASVPVHLKDLAIDPEVPPLRIPAPPR